MYVKHTQGIFLERAKKVGYKFCCYGSCVGKHIHFAKYIHFTEPTHRSIRFIEISR